MIISDSMIDQLAALDQAESHFRSENIKFGIYHRMRSGKTVLNHTQFLGYIKGPDGTLQIVPEEAEIVRKIFDYEANCDNEKLNHPMRFSFHARPATLETDWARSRTPA